MNSSEIVTYLDWDSTFFDMKIAKIVDNYIEPNSLEDAFVWCNSHKIDCLYFLCDSDSITSITLAEENKFHLVDIRITFRKTENLVPSELDLKFQANIRDYVVDDIPRLKAMAKESFRFTRFYNDGNFERDRCDALYETWAEKATHETSGFVIVAEIESQAVGYITGKASQAIIGKIELIAVDSRFRGLGIGHALVNGALDWFSKRNIASVEVVTQGRNIKAQRMYQKNGFSTDAIQLWYHKWFGKNYQ